MTESQPGAAGADMEPVAEIIVTDDDFDMGLIDPLNVKLPQGRSLLYLAPPAAAPAVQTELTDFRSRLADKCARLAEWEPCDCGCEGNTPKSAKDVALVQAAAALRRSLLSGTRTCVQAGDSQTQEIAHLAASQASRTSEGAAGVAVAPAPSLDKVLGEVRHLAANGGMYMKEWQYGFAQKAFDGIVEAVDKARAAGVLVCKQTGGCPDAQWCGRAGVCLNVPPPPCVPPSDGGQGNG